MASYDSSRNVLRSGRITARKPGFDSKKIDKKNLPHYSLESYNNYKRQTIVSTPRIFPSYKESILRVQQA
jgi:hypothetical protein